MEPELGPQWQLGFCDWYKLGPLKCLYACFCTPCAAGEVSSRIGDSFAFNCMMPWVIQVLCGIPTHCCIWVETRQHLRKKYGINPRTGPIMDCVSFACCAPCMIAQELGEVNYQREGPGDYNKFPVLDDNDNEEDDMAMKRN